MRTFLRRYLGIGELHIGPSQYVLNVVVACGIVFLIGGIFQQIYFYSILGFVVNVPMMMYIFYVSYKRLMDIVYGNDVTGEKAQFPYFVIILGFLWGYIPSVGIVWLSIASQLLFFFCFLFLSVFPSRKDTLHEKFSYRIILQYLGIGENFIDHDQYLRNLILTLPLLIFSFYGYGMTTFLVIMSGDGGVSFGMMIFFGVFFWILISYVSYLVYKRGVSKKRGEIKIPFWGFLVILFVPAIGFGWSISYLKDRVTKKKRMCTSIPRSILVFLPKKRRLRMWMKKYFESSSYIARCDFEDTRTIWTLFHLKFCEISIKSSSRTGK